MFISGELRECVLRDGRVVVETMSAASDKTNLARQGSLLLMTSVSANSISCPGRQPWRGRMDTTDAVTIKHASSKDVNEN